MSDTPSLRNHLLVAMPALADPNFSQSVTLLCEHNDEGALGVVINRPIDLSLGELLAHLGLETDDAELAARPVYQGGPVQTERGFVLHEPLGDWEHTLAVTETLGLTTSGDILSALATGEGPERVLVALGYAGWGAGQLESELAHNAWLHAPADPELVFDLPVEERWQAAARLLGVDLALLSGDTGHA
jgi:putative transcriptional regulator